MAVATRTGAEGINLVVKEGQLRPGATYTFTLTVTHSGGSAEATRTVVMNRPPWGGGVKLEYESPAVALTTKVQIIGSNWVDDPEDLPLEYSFAARAMAQAAAKAEASKYVQVPTPACLRAHGLPRERACPVCVLQI